MVIFDYSPNAFFCLLGLATVLLFSIVRYWQVARIRTRLSPPDNSRRLFFGAYSRFWAFVRSFLFAIGLLALAIAAFQPRWGKKPQSVVSQGRNVLFVLDMSRSMLAEDLPPNRLTFAKMKIRRLLEKLGPERMGLLLFSDRAFLHCPFTTDSMAFVNFLDIAEKVTLSSGGTNMAAALDEAKITFDSIGAAGLETKNKIVIVLSDGEDFSRDLQSALARAKKAQINVIFLGTATTEGAPVPVLSKSGKVGGHQTGKDGQVVITKLDLDFVKKVSAALDGRAVKITVDDSDVDQMVGFISKYELEVFSKNKLDLYEERQSILSTIFFLSWVLRWLI